MFRDSKLIICFIVVHKIILSFFNSQRRQTMKRHVASPILRRQAWGASRASLYPRLFSFRIHSSRSYRPVQAKNSLDVALASSTHDYNTGMGNGFHVRGIAVSISRLLLPFMIEVYEHITQVTLKHAQGFMSIVALYAPNDMRVSSVID